MSDDVRLSEETKAGKGSSEQTPETRGRMLALLGEQWKSLMLASSLQKAVSQSCASSRCPADDAAVKSIGLTGASKSKYSIR